MLKMHGRRMLYPISSPPNSMFRISSSMMVWPLILAGGCFAPLWPMLV